MKKVLLNALIAAVALPAMAEIPVDFDRIQNWTGEGPNRAALLICNDAGASDPYGYVWGYRWQDGETPSGEDMFKAICANNKDLVLLTQFTGIYGSTVCGIGFGDAEKLLENIYFDFDMAKDYEFVNFDYFQANTLFGQSSAPGDETPVMCQAAIDEAISNHTHIIQHPIDYKAYGYPAYDYDCWFMHEDGNAYGWWNSAWYTGYWSYWLASSVNDEWSYSGVGFSGRGLSDGCIDAWSFTMFPEAMVGGIGIGQEPPSDESLVVYRPANDESGIDDTMSSHHMPTVYYNLSGIKVASSFEETIPDLPSGIYVSKRGCKTSKIFVK